MKPNVISVILILAAAVSPVRAGSPDNSGDPTPTPSPTATAMPSPMPVTVQNTPLPVKAADNPAFQPYEQSLSANAASNNSYAQVTFPVPAGKRLVVELVTIVINLPPGQYPQFIDVNSHELAPPTVPISFVNQSLFSVTQPMRFYAGAGTPTGGTFNNGVVVAVLRSGTTGNWGYNVSISGYLVDLH